MSQAQATANQRVNQWFESRNWRPFSFQRSCWQAYQSGQDFLLHSTTGSGKTYAAWLGPVRQFLNQPSQQDLWPKVRGRIPSPPLTVVWVTPLRALSADTEKALRIPLEDLGLPWTLETRTGDTSSATRSRQRRQLPTALITTPESLTLLLSYPESFQQFASLRCIVIDEWHELMGTKRGTQTELALTRLRSIAPAAVTCGLSATLGNTEESLKTLVGVGSRSQPAKVITGAPPRKIQVRSLLPKTMERFPWAGHLGLINAQNVVEVIEEAKSTLVFTNTRNQAERWYQKLLSLRPDWAGLIALHHGSLDRVTRNWVEESMRDGKLLATVCTSSLDLGVDFPEVEQVIQVGSPKGAARLIQRAGRSHHTPGKSSRIYFVPTNALELIELASARDIIENQKPLESRHPMETPLDCLAQHAVTMALAGPYTQQEFLSEVRTSFSYRNLSLEQLDWIFNFVVQGGASLQAYPEFHRVNLNDSHQYQVHDRRIARLQRMSIGTIASEMAVEVKYLNGQRLGAIEERFVSRLKRGDRFLFAGNSLELLRMNEGTAVVRRSKKKATTAPSWAGGRMPLSSRLSTGIRSLLDAAGAGHLASAEMKSLKALLELQKHWSVIPAANQLLIECFTERGKFKYAVYPFDGRLVHEGMGAIVAQRIAEQSPQTVSIAANDFGFLIESSSKKQWDVEAFRGFLSSQNILATIESSLNATEMAKRQFREIARIAGLIHPGYPGQPKRARHLQASSNMFYDVFQEYEPCNRFLQQAKVEVLERQLEWERLQESFDRIENSEIVLTKPRGFTPFAFPLIVDRMRDRISSESLDERARRLVAQMEKKIGSPENKNGKQQS